MNYGAITRRIRRCESETPAQLVLEHAINEAIIAEREACALLAEEEADNAKYNGVEAACLHIAQAIRERGEKK